MFRRKTWLAAGAAAAALVVAGGAATAFAAGGWTVTTITGSPGDNVGLNGAFARTSTDAWVVGQQFGPAGAAAPPSVTYHWNGTSWTPVATPALGVATSLNAVSASSATDAWAVGTEFTGRRSHSTLLEHWNGSAWSVDTADAISGGVGVQLTGVVDLSATNAYAIGQDNTGTLLEHWNGSTWTPITVPDPDFTPGSGQAISADSPSDIWVVGSGLNATTFAATAEALHFNGTSWSVVQLAQPGANTPSIEAVTALSPTNAWAAGTDIGATSPVGGGTLLEHWNGAAWSIVASPTPGGDPGITGIAARSATDVIAVGSTLPSINGGPLQALILRWNGTSWSDDTGGTIPGWLRAAAAAPGAAQEWAAGNSSGATGQILSHP